MKTYLVLFFLGLVQGVAEFLPISSSGHLVLFSLIFGVSDSLFVSILLHFATLLSIVVVFWKDILRLITHPFSAESINYVLATIPTCIIALILLPVVKLSFSGVFLPFCFLISACMLFFADKRSHKQNFSHAIAPKDAFTIGIAQGLAVFAGISRSGATISAGIFSGVKKKEVARFSFLLSIPIIVLSMLMEVYDIIKGGVTVEYPIWALAISFLTAFLSGIFALKYMLKLTEKGNFWLFSLYLIIVGFLSFFII